MRPRKKKLLRLGIVVVVLIAAGTLITDCDDWEAPKPKVPTKAAVAAGRGIVRGLVKFTGVATPVRIISGENECCPGAEPAPDETAVVNANGTLQNVVVFVKDGPNVGADTDAATLDQKDCRYRPHVLAVQTNQPLDITCHDATMHNVYLAAVKNPALNFSESGIGATHPLSFAYPELITIKCAVHPWMLAYVYVFDHPCFAVTGADGTFQIGRLPAGSYTLVAWQEKYGMLEQPFTVRDDQPGTVNFEYKAP